MTRRSRIWLAVAALFTGVNLAGGIYAAVMGEVLHTATHCVLLVLGGYWMWWIASRARPRKASRTEAVGTRLEYLQQSVDAMALEVERIGEAQRFSDRLRAQRSEGAQSNPEP